MPEYLAPGVYVEETSFRSKSIEGVSTTTTGFVGPARYGPLDLEPDVLTRLVECERIYVSRVFEPAPATGGATGTSNGRATWPPGGGTDGLTIQARFPGAVGN